MQSSVSWTHRQYSKAYVSDEMAAQQARQGVWKGAFEAPANWRKDHRKPTTAAQPEVKTPVAVSGKLFAFYCGHSSNVMHNLTASLPYKTLAKKPNQQN